MEDKKHETTTECTNTELLASLQSTPIHAPPGARPFCTGTHSLTKTQLAAKRKVKKEAKAKLAEDKEITIAVRKVKREAKKQERAILMADSKAAKGSAKADNMCVKLANKIKTGHRASSLDPKTRYVSTRKAKGGLVVLQ